MELPASFPWENIEQCPKDSRTVYLMKDAAPDHAGRVSSPFVGRWSDKRSRWINATGGYAVSQPTQYMPLNRPEALAEALRVALAALEDHAHTHDRVGHPLLPKNKDREILAHIQELLK